MHTDKIAGLVLVLAGAVCWADDARKLITFNDNGAWCWFQDPRVIHDASNDTLLIASVAASEGPNGDARAGDIDLVTYELKSGAKNRVVLHHALLPQDHH